MTRDRIVGIGSPHGDDSIGWLLIERLRERADLQAELFLASPAQVTYLARECDRLILIDAAETDLPLGHILRIAWPDPRIFATSRQSTHGIGIGDALRLAEVLGHLPSRVVLLCVSAARGQPLAPPHPSVLATVENLESAIVVELKRDI